MFVCFLLLVCSCAGVFDSRVRDYCLCCFLCGCLFVCVVCVCSRFLIWCVCDFVHLPLLGSMSMLVLACLVACMFVGLFVCVLVCCRGCLCDCSFVRL